MRLEDALDLAQSRSLDLVEVAPNAAPPVCRLMDFGRFKYEQTKKQREARKGTKQLVLKEIWFRPNVDDHDRDFKTKQIVKFLEEGDKVKATVRFRGRELAHVELGKNVLSKVADALEGVANIEKQPLMEGRAMTMIVAPGKALQKTHVPPAGTRPLGSAPEEGAAPAAQPRPVSQPVRTPAPVA
jgi:translation initiation factor IF-3